MCEKHICGIPNNFVVKPPPVPISSDYRGFTVCIKKRNDRLDSCSLAVKMANLI